MTDITLPIHGDMLVYPGDSPPRIRRISSIESGSPLTSSELILGCHVGTHVDAPAHFLAGGLTVAELDQTHCFGPAIVIDLSRCSHITPDDLHNVVLPRRRHILLKTRNSALLHGNSYDPDYCYLLPEAVERLLSSDPLSIGFDYYSLDPPSDSRFPAHLALARRGLPAFVCLNLLRVEAGLYTFSAFPLRIPGIEGSPVRAFVA